MSAHGSLGAADRSGPGSRTAAIALVRALQTRPRPSPPLAGGGHARQYDESGFPVPERIESLAERIRRLLAT